MKNTSVMIRPMLEPPPPPPPPRARLAIAATSCSFARGDRPPARPQRPPPPRARPTIPATLCSFAGGDVPPAPPYFLFVRRAFSSLRGPQGLKINLSPPMGRGVPAARAVAVLRRRRGAREEMAA